MKKAEKNGVSWQKGGAAILTPLLVYVGCSQLFQMAGEALLPAGFTLAHPIAMQGIENLLLLPILFILFYRQDQITANGEKAIRKERFAGRKKTILGWLAGEGKRAWKGRRELLLVLGASICLSRGLNQLLSLTPFPQWFPAYKEANVIVLAEPFWVQLGAAVVAAPLLEELLMRGIVYGRMRKMADRWLAVIGSSLIFAWFHGNVVQGLYAFFLGILFAWLLEEFQSLWAPALAHAGANGSSILLNRMGGVPLVGKEQQVWLLISTAVFLLLGCVFLWRIEKEGGKTDDGGREGC